jgi:phosphatidylglycerol:prolipoprotein diacylglycerol transferase
MKIDLDPILLDLGLIRLSGYGLMYMFGFLVSYYLVRYRRKRKDFGISKPEVDDLYFYSILGLIIGARLGYGLFYNLEMYVDNPLEIPAFWRGGNVLSWRIDRCYHHGRSILLEE